MRTDFKAEIMPIRVASIARRTEALGPGTRAVLWVQGCPFRCPGCIAPDWIPRDGGAEMTAEATVSELLSTNVTGLTFSGGEPMEQAQGLAEVARLARRSRELDIICFTGYLYERLCKDPPNPGVSALLGQIDVLIDGPYVASLNDSVGLRGSSNQRIIHLTSRLKDYNLEGQARKVEIVIEGDSMSLIGIPTPPVLSSLDYIAREQNERKVWP